MNHTLKARMTPLKRFVAVLVGLVASGSLFLAIPLIHAVSTGFRSPNRMNEVSMSLPPPPAALEVQVPPPPKQEEKESPELDREPPRLTLEQLDMALSPSMGDAIGGVSLDLSLDARSLGTEELIFNIDEVDEKPRALRMVQPVYPAALQRRGIQGKVYLILVIDAAGNVHAPRVERSTNVEFEQPALDAVRRWKFSPGKRAGEAVKVRVRLPLEFVPN
jgi:protein TonB